MTSKQVVKAILIDPFEMTVSEVFYGGELSEINDLIAAKPFTVASFGDAGDGIFIDDEGLFRQCQRFFKFEGYPEPLAGRGLILGSDENGDSVAPAISLEAVKASVRWVQPLTHQLWIDCDSGDMLSTADLCTG